ncbi:MAG: DUF2142 domain-containing protein [Dactylosporangium sp.]|nr:DUF2142 domain-containing protein [Dactylosporangium sp.]NNJ61168.1 DUF2142 domain-containing protein [Dactylosporangium sp.]
MGAAWATAAPYNGVADEINHAQHAAGVGRGEFIPVKASQAEGAGAFHHVKAGLTKTDLCWQGIPRESADCAAEPDGDQTLVRVHSYAGRYPPAYYAVVGWPLALWPGWGGVLTARLLSAALVSLFLAFAAHALLRWLRHPMMTAAVLVAITPITLHFAGSINPAALEIAAGLALFAGLVALLFPREPVAPRAALVLAGISAITLVIVRPFGPLWAFVIFGVLLVPSSRAVLRRVFALPMVRLWVAGLAAACVAALTWIVLMGTGERGWVSPVDLSTIGALKFELIQRLDEYPRQMVGVLAWLDAPLAGPSYVLWFMAFGLLYCSGLALGTWTQRWRLIVLTLVTFAVPIVGDTLGARTYGLVSQGRYVLPIAVGLPVLAAYALGDRAVFVGGAARSVTRLLAVPLVLIHFGGLINTMIRWQYGIPGFPKAQHIDPFGGDWIPPLGPYLPVALGTLAVGLMLAYAWAASAEASKNSLHVGGVGRSIPAHVPANVPD